MRPGVSDPGSAGGADGLWRDGNYLRYRLARTISLLGGLISEIAYPLLILRLGGDDTQAGTVVTCALVTMAICEIPGGHLADRFDRRTLMIVADLVRFAAVGSLPLAMAWSGLGYPQIVAVAIIDGAATGVFLPATTGLLRDLVGRERIGQALGHTQVWRAAVVIAGPILGGLLFEVRAFLPFAADAISFVVSAGLLLRVSVASHAAGGASAPPDQRVTAGIKWFCGQPLIMRLLAFAGVINLASAATSIAVVIALRQHGTAAGAIGCVMTCVGAGAFVGAPLARPIGVRLGPVRVCGLVGAAWCVAFVTLALTASAWVAGPMLALPFFVSPIAAVTLGTAVYGAAPRDLLGRIRSAEQLITSSLATAGPLLAGIGLQLLGASNVWLTLGAVVLLATVFAVVPVFPRARSRPGVSKEPLASGQCG